MQIYRHALLLVQNETDGLLLLEQAERLAKEMGTRITVGHLSADYRELDYTSDSLTKDRQSREVIDAKAMLSHLVESSNIDIKVRAIVSIHRLPDNIPLGIGQLIHNAADSRTFRSDFAGQWFLFCPDMTANLIVANAVRAGNLNEHFSVRNRWLIPVVNLKHPGRNTHRVLHRHNNTLLSLTLFFFRFNGFVKHVFFRLSCGFLLVTDQFVF
ncbi:Uncharacterised protein [Enterobacter hormaechei]|nr:Uncharacterised protein [Enterobacter hormaechei]